MTIRNATISLDGKPITGTVTNVAIDGKPVDQSPDPVPLPVGPFDFEMKLTEVDGYPVADAEEAGVAMQEAVTRMFAIIKFGAHRVRLSDLLDERGSMVLDRVEWRSTPDGCETKINGSKIAVRQHPSGGPTPTWSGYIDGAFEPGYQADNARDVMARLLQRVAFD
mgnify:CR=1 FL=1